MRLHIRGAKFDSPEARKEIVMFLSATIEGNSSRRFEPYEANDGDDRNWALDSNNNWRVIFPVDDKTAFDLRYRYQGGAVKAEEALATWLGFCVGATQAPTGRMAGPVCVCREGAGVDPEGSRSPTELRSTEE